MARCNGNQKVKTHKVFQGHVELKVDLPPRFCRKAAHENSILAYLHTPLGTWEVEATRDDRRRISFVDGWPKFVAENNVGVGYFIVFKHIGRMHFKVHVFDPTCCEAIDSDVENSMELANAGDEVMANEAPLFESQNPHFMLTIRSNHAKKTSKPTIPAEFVRSNNLGKRTSMASLRDPEGRVFNVKVDADGSTYLRLRFGSGWKDFYCQNELVEGDICVFELGARSTSGVTVSFDVHIVRQTV